MASEGIFRFITVRPAKAAVTTTGLTILSETSGLFQRLSSAAAEGADRKRLREIARNYSESDDSSTPADRLLDLGPLRTWFYEHQGDQLASAGLDRLVQEAYGMSLADMVASDEYAGTRARLTDRLLTTILLGDETDAGEQDLLDAKLLGLVARLAGRPPTDAATPAPAGSYTREVSTQDSQESLGEMIAGTPAMLPRFFATVREEPAPVEPPSAKTHTQDEARAWLASLEHARRDLLRQIMGGRHLVYSRLTAPVEENGDMARGDVQDADRAGDTSPDAPLDGGAVQPRLSAEGVALLSDEARAVLDRLGLRAGEVMPFQAITLIEAEMHHASGQISDIAATGLIAFDGGEIDVQRFREALSDTRRITAPPPVPQHSEAGVADLLVVRQKIKAYELGELAHVENVMAGETRERGTRRLTQIEEITETETEVETEKEKDLQSTQRNELQNEAEKHVKSQLDIEAGLQVSGSFGPAVSFTSSLKAGYSTTTEESQRKASSFSQEVTQRTVEKVRERVRTLVRRRTLEEFEENNRHGFANTTAKHNRGIYRWMNKVYDAQVFNYGQRLMFDFVVPEPAAYLLYGLVENPPQDSELVKPTAPTVAGFPLRPSHIGPGTYGDLVAKYRVVNAPAMPAAIRTTTFFEKQDGATLGNYGRAGKIEVPRATRPQP